MLAFLSFLRFLCLPQRASLRRLPAVDAPPTAGKWHRLHAGPDGAVVEAEERLEVAALRQRSDERVHGVEHARVCERPAGHGHQVRLRLRRTVGPAADGVEQAHALARRSAGDEQVELGNREVLAIASSTGQRFERRRPHVAAGRAGRVERVGHAAVDRDVGECGARVEIEQACCEHHRFEFAPRPPQLGRAGIGAGVGARRLAASRTGGEQQPPGRHALGKLASADAERISHDVTLTPRDVAACARRFSCGSSLPESAVSDASIDVSAVNSYRSGRREVRCCHFAAPIRRAPERRCDWPCSISTTPS